MKTFSLIDRPSSGRAKRSYTEDLDNDSEGNKRVKMRDLDSILRSEGLRKCSKLTEAEQHGHRKKEDESSQITETAAASSLSNKPVQLKTVRIPEPNGICLSVGLVGNSVQSPANVFSKVASKQSEETRRHFSVTKAENEPDPYPKCTVGLALDLNKNIFHPYKKLGQVRSVDASECGSTTVPVESEPLRMWKEMKQNGFLSSSHGGIPIPKQRACPAKRRKDKDLKKKSELAKKEEESKYTKLAAPTGLLSGLNPGIIKHVRNSKQVNSVIESLLRSEKREDKMKNRSVDHCESVSMGTSANNSAGNLFSLFLNGISPCTLGSYMSGHSCYLENPTASDFNSGDANDSLTLELSSAVSMASENASSAWNDDLSGSQDSLTSLSLKGASVASQWLDLLQQDIRGRLAALRRSKKRVMNAIQTELPYLFSREIASKENGIYGGHSSEGGYPKIEVVNMHFARWQSIFIQMDKALDEEEKHLETWLKQVQDVHSHCERGLKYFEANGLAGVGRLGNLRGLKNTDIVERKNAVRSSAASIYSTCNLVTTKENVPCC